MAFDKYFGFNLTQRKTLADRLNEVAAGIFNQEQADTLDDLKDILSELEALAAEDADILAAAAVVAALPTADPESDFAVWLDGTTIRVSNGN